MAWTIDYEGGPGIIVTTYRGTSNVHDLRDATTAAIALGKTHESWRFLTDASEGTFDVAPIALLNLPAKQYPAEGADRRSRLALLLPSAAKDRALARFYETVCLNRGWLAQSFDDRDEARGWLLEDAGS